MKKQKHNTNPKAALCVFAGITCGAALVLSPLQIHAAESTALPVTSTAEQQNDVIASGEKNYISWTLTADGTLTVVIAETLSDEEAKAEIGIMDGEKVIIDNGNNMDVNGTGILDASDAQLVYNMYNAVYNEFTSDVTMEKFLRADANGDNKVDVKDAEVIINKILSGKAN